MRDAPAVSIPVRNRVKCQHHGWGRKIPPHKKKKKKKTTWMGRHDRVFPRGGNRGWYHGLGGRRKMGGELPLVVDFVDKGL